MKTARTTFFTRDKNFYKTFFWLMLVVALQNLVAYSVNMLDNIMLGSYSQNALSGAATVNQIFFIVNQLALSIGNALVAICSQYWGKQETEEIRKLTGAALALSILIAAVGVEDLIVVDTDDAVLIRDSLYVHAGAAPGNIYDVT